MTGKQVASSTSQMQSNGHFWSELLNVIWKFIGHGGAKQHVKRLEEKRKCMLLNCYRQQEGQQETKDSCR